MKKFTSLLVLLLAFFGAVQSYADVYDRSGWTVKCSSDCEDGSSGKITYATDGDVSTYWHSYWSGAGNSSGYTSSVSLPQFIYIDLGSEMTVGCVGYIPRSATANGTVSGYKVFTSTTDILADWDGSSDFSSLIPTSDPFASGTWTYASGFSTSDDIQVAAGTWAVTARYVLFVATSSLGDSQDTWASCAEIYVSSELTMTNPFKKEAVERKTLIDTSKYLQLGSAATSVTVSDDSNTQWYALYNVGRTAYIQENGTGSSLYMRATDTAALAYAQAAEAKQQYLFKFTKGTADGKYHIISALNTTFSIGGSSSTSYLPYTDGSNFKDFTVELIDGATDCFYIQETDNSYIANGNAAGGTFVGWGTTAPTSASGNSCYQLIPVSIIDEVPNFLIDEFSNTKVYTITTAARGYLGYDATVSETNLTGEQATGVTDAFDKKFAILKSSSNKTYLYNIKSGKFVSRNSSVATTQLSTEPKTSGFTLIENNSNSITHPYLLAIDGQHFGISSWYDSKNGYTGYNQILFYQGVNDAGNQMLIEEVSGETFESAVALARIALYEYINSLSSYNIGTTYGTYTASADYTNALNAAQTALANADATESDLTSAKTALETAAANGFTLNTPADGAFIRIRAHKSNYYLAGANGTSYAAGATKTDDPTGTVFYYKGNNLINLSNGYYLTRTSSGNGFAQYNGITSDRIAFNVAANTSSYTSNGDCLITFTGANGSSRYLYLESTESNAGGSVNNANYVFDIEDVTELPIQITEAGYATLCLPVAVNVPAEGVKVYYITEDKESSVEITAQDITTIPANTPVLIAGNAGTYNFTINKDDATEAATTGLTGIIAAENIATGTNAYVLANPSTGVGFYVLSSESRGVKGFRGYYAPANATATGFTFDFGKTTSIESAIADAINGDAPIYDLSGRKVSKAVKGRIYIQNGKKVIK